MNAMYSESSPQKGAGLQAHEYVEHTHPVLTFWPPGRGRIPKCYSGYVSASSVAPILHCYVMESGEYDAFRRWTYVMLDPIAQLYSLRSIFRQLTESAEVLCPQESYIIIARWLSS